MNTSIGDQTFDGSDSILVFNHLIRMVEECDILEISEYQGLIVLSYYLRGNAKKMYQTARSGVKGTGVTSWCGAIQWFLLTNADSATIRDAVQDFHSTRKKPYEDEPSLSNRFRVSAYRCGKVFTESEKINVFIDGLHQSIQTLVARYRESAGRTLYLEALVAYARAEGEAYRARRPTHTRFPKGVLPTPVRNVNLVEDDSAIPHFNTGKPEMLGLLPDWTATSGKAETQKTDNEALLYGERQHQAGRIPYSGPTIRQNCPE